VHTTRNNNTENLNIYLFIVQVKDKCTKTNIVLSKALDQSHETEVEWFSFTNSQARGIVFEYLRNNPTANCKLNVRNIWRDIPAVLPRSFSDILGPLHI
jgi:hypothetical protein